MSIHDSMGRATPPPAIAAALAQHAVLSERAVLVGNRAGVVEWANDAWTRITGFPLDQTLSKPIAHFLGEADLELELIDFVSQRYLEGRPCTIEFPFETFDDRSIWVHLEVQPIRNALGEIVEFVAVATDETERRTQDLASEAATAKNRAGQRPEVKPGTADSPLTEARDTVILADEAERLCTRLARHASPSIGFDLALDPSRERVRGNRLLLRELISHVLESAVEGIDGDWGTITLMSGRTLAGRGHASEAHPIIVRPMELREACWHFLEIHDSGSTLDPADLLAARRGAASRTRRARRLAVAGELARLLGGSLHLDSTPGCGTQALLLLPIRD